MLVSKPENRNQVFPAVVLSAVGLGLVCLIITHSFAAYFAHANPELALRLNSHEPTALVTLARAHLGRVLRETGGAGDEETTDVTDRLSGFANSEAFAAANDSTEDDAVNWTTNNESIRANIRALAERAIAADPLNSTALYLLGWSANADGERQRATALMQAAAKRSFRETPAVYDLLLRSFEAHQYGQVLDYADAILRTASRMTHYVVPIVARVAEDGNAKDLLAEQLARNPPWRGALLARLPGAVKDARTPLNILLALRDSGAPPSSDELRGYIDVLIRNNLYELAYYTWLQFLSPDDLTRTGLLYNGSFDRPFSGLPFDWVIRRGAGVTIQVSSEAGLNQGQALNIEFGYGRIDFGGVSQMVLLAPGTYRFRGRFKGEIAGRRGLVWRIACAGKRDFLGESEMMVGSAPTWRTFSFSFEVPQEPSCRAQQVSLALDARSTSEKLVSGQVWYGELAIERM